MMYDSFEAVSKLGDGHSVRQHSWPANKYIKVVDGYMCYNGEKSRMASIPISRDEIWEDYESPHIGTVLFDMVKPYLAIEHQKHVHYKLKERLDCIHEALILAKESLVFGGGQLEAAVKIDEALTKINEVLNG